MTTDPATTDHATTDPATDSLPMIAVPLRAVMLSYNHLTYAIKSGSFTNLNVDEMKSVIDNVVIMKSLIPESLRKQVE
jgi:hypothetical protein